ncbi:hypothetical protein CCP4SC76_2290005 [Gammaproteobacteria bacterium]
MLMEQIFRIEPPTFDFHLWYRTQLSYCMKNNYKSIIKR